MSSLVARVRQHPTVEHLTRAVERYLGRLGSQFGAAITYFSVLALVPTLMLGFAVLGFILTVARPDLIEPVVQSMTGALGASSGPTNADLAERVASWLRDYRAVGVTAGLLAAYSGAAWMNNLKNAVRAQWRPEPDLQPAKQNIVLLTLLNLLQVLGLLFLVLLTFALAAVATSLTDTVLALLGLDGIGWLVPLFRLVPIVFSIGAGFVLFLYLYRILPETRARWPVLWRGALMGAVGLAVLQYLTGILFGVFSGNAAAALFGPVITLMLFFNLFAQLILFVAAWIATADAPAAGSDPDGDVRFALRPPVEEAAAAGPAAPTPVPQVVAARSVQIGMGAGYLTGAATGVGLGALVAGLAARIGRRRRSED